MNDHERAGSGHREPTTAADRERLRHDSFNWFLHETNPANGLVIDKTAPDWPASIAATGLGLDEREIRSLADAFYRRADGQWAQDGSSTVTHGWKPEGGLLEYRWKGCDEALLLSVLGLGSPSRPRPETGYSA